MSDPLIICVVDPPHGATILPLNHQPTANGRGHQIGVEAGERIDSGSDGGRSPRCSQEGAVNN